MVTFGPIPGVPVGQWFASRCALHEARVHPGLMRGIAPAGASVVLSGGYVDDVDQGDGILYTGEGGRDAVTGRQMADQPLTGGNLALAQNCLDGQPIRVTRGHRLASPYAPEAGYRYDGLYRIDAYWSERGQDGYGVWRFRLLRLDGQPPLGVLEAELPAASSSMDAGRETPQRSQIIISRIIRSSTVGTAIKHLYKHTCQVCGLRLVTPAGFYAECCHIRPLGAPHGGPGQPNNVLCLCPNHHVLFDTHALHLTDTLTVLETGEPLRLHPLHQLNLQHIRYHRRLMPGLDP
jgi:putative restriction endonuclease